MPGAVNSESMPALSVVMPTFNNEAVLTRAVDGWRRFGGDEVEIVVIEDGCRDGTAAYLAGLHETAWGRRHLRLGEPQRERQGDEALLRAVVQVSLEPPAGLVLGRDDPRPGCPDLLLLELALLHVPLQGRFQDAPIISKFALQSAVWLALARA